MEFINPKFENEQEALYSQKIIIEFAQNCNITANEYMLALDLASRRLLTLNGEVIKVFREIDRLKLGEIETAFTEYKRHDPNAEKGEKMINQHLNQEKEPSEAEKELERKRFLTNAFNKYKATGEIIGGTLLYEKLRKRVSLVGLDFLDNFIRNYTGERVEKTQGLIPFRVEKTNLKVEWATAYVKQFCDLKLSQLNLNGWIEFWEQYFIEKSE